MVSSFLPKFIVCFIRLRPYIIFYLSVIYKSYILQMVFSMLNFISDSGNIIMEVLMKKDYTKLWTLFRSMFVLSACTFGGGFVIVSLMKKNMWKNYNGWRKTKCLTLRLLPSLSLIHI